MRKIYLVVLLLCSGNAYSTNVFVQGGLHVGGDELIEAEFDNGDDEDIKAGELISLSVGVGTDLDENTEARLMVGVKFDSINADNGDIDFFRYPVTALVMYKTSEKISIGGGVTYHLNPGLSGDGVASVVDVDFDDALGFVLGAEYQLSNGGYAGIQFTSIDYEVSGIDVSGNSIGLILGFRF